MAWQCTGSIDPCALVDARLQLHWAAQAAAGVGRTLNAPRADDSHTAFSWSADEEALLQEPVTRARGRSAVARSDAAGPRCGERGAAAARADAGRGVRVSGVAFRGDVAAPGRRPAGPSRGAWGSVRRRRCGAVGTGAVLRERGGDVRRNGALLAAPLRHRHAHRAGRLADDRHRDVPRRRHVFRAIT